SFLSLLMMRAVARMRHREVFATIGGILIFVLVFFGQTMLSSRLSSSNSAELVKAMTARGGLVTQASRIYPPSEWLTFALSGNSAPKYFLYLLGLSAAAVYIVIALSSRIYQKGMQVQFESPKGGSRKKYRFSSSSPVITIVKNEWISIIKTPVYAMNTLLGIILAPLVLIMPAFSGGSDTSSMIRLLHLNVGSFVMILIFAGVMSFFGLINPAAATAISREGKCLWLMKTIPLPPRTQLLGKFWSGYSISALIVLATAVSLAAVYRLSLAVVLVASLLALALLLTTTAFSLMVDVIRPKLTWSNQTEAIKQNMNSLFAMLIGFLVVVFFVAVSIALLLLNLPAAVSVIILLALLSGAAIGTTEWMFWLFDRKFYNMSI
ncbi:MAG TPA: hypothetical protein VHR42_01760, partial [Clostridia bacterium]|nr:hypothetical protein [Clostridia bacterium]